MIIPLVDVLVQMVLLVQRVKGTCVRDTTRIQVLNLFQRSIFLFKCIILKKGGYCSDGGWCMNVREMFSLYGYTYGAEFDQVTYTRPVSRTVPSGWNTAYRQGKS